MLDGIREYVKNNLWAQYVLVLVAGIAIGAVFYPTKHIEETERRKHEEESKVLKEERRKEVGQLRESLDKVVKESSEYRKETERKLVKLTTENTTLKSNQKTAYYKVVRPDGTIEIKKFTETEVNESRQVITSIQQEFKEKITAIETKWEAIHKERVSAIQKEYASKEETYKRQIDELERKRVVDINKKSFGVEAGVTTKLSYYGHASYDIFGPIFLGLHGQFGTESAAGAGLGLRF